MAATRRRFTTEYKVEAAHRVIDSDRSVAEVARDLSLNEATPYSWVRDERRRIEAAKGTDSEPLSAAERAELLRLRNRSTSRKRTSSFWEKQRRTSPRVNQTRALCVDGGGVRQLRDRSHGPTAQGLLVGLLSLVSEPKRP
jgi:transposase